MDCWCCYPGYLPDLTGPDHKLEEDSKVLNKALKITVVALAAICVLTAATYLFGLTGLGVAVLAIAIGATIYSKSSSNDTTEKTSAVAVAAAAAAAFSAVLEDESSLPNEAYGEAIGDITEAYGEAIGDITEAYGEAAIGDITEAYYRVIGDIFEKLEEHVEGGGAFIEFYIEASKLKDDLPIIKQFNSDLHAFILQAIEEKGNISAHSVLDFIAQQALKEMDTRLREFYTPAFTQYTQGIDFDQAVTNHVVTFLESRPESASSYEELLMKYQEKEDLFCGHPLLLYSDDELKTLASGHSAEIREILKYELGRFDFVDPIGTIKPSDLKMIYNIAKPQVNLNEFLTTLLKGNKPSDELIGECLPTLCSEFEKEGKICCLDHQQPEEELRADIDTIKSGLREIDERLYRRYGVQKEEVLRAADDYFTRVTGGA